MHDQISRGNAAAAGSQAIELSAVVAERVVLSRVLDLYPDHLTVCELVREIAGHSRSFAQQDAITSAIRDLASAGLLRYCDGLVLPTGPALRFHRIAI